MKRTETDWIKIGDRYYQDKFAVFCIETTGLSANDSQIIEIGAVKSENSRIIDKFSAFVNPGVAISAETEKQTGITNSMLEKEAQIDTVLPRFIAFCEDSRLAVHNAMSAMKFIRANCDRQGISCQFGVLDTYVLAHMILKEQSAYTLEAVADMLGIPFASQHRAVEAAEVTAQILYKLVEITKETDREWAMEERQKKAKVASMAGILDDIRRDAIAKVRSLNESELKSGWPRISETVVDLMVCNELTLREGILILEDIQIKLVKNAFLKDIIKLIVCGSEPDLIAEAASNKYWIDEPTGIDAMVRYMQIKGVLLMFSCTSNFELNKLLLCLIPEKLRSFYEWEIGTWEDMVQEKVKEQRMKFDKALKEEMEERED